MRTRCWLLALALALFGCDTRKPDPAEISDAGPDESGAAVAYRFPLDSIEQLGLVPYGTPPADIVYDLRAEQGNSAPQVLHIDADGIYWIARTSRIYRGSLTGQTPPEEMGRCVNGCGQSLDSDATHLYWLDRTQLRRRSKTLDPEEAAPLQWDHESGALAVGQRYAYVSMPGCVAITRVNKQTLEQETTSSPISRGVGETVLAVLPDGTVYCGSWARILRVSEWGKADVIYSGPDRELGDTRVSAMKLTSGHVVWLDRGSSGGGVARIGKLPLQRGSDPTFFQMPYEGAVNDLEFDGASTLVLMKGSWLVEVDLDSGRFAYVATDYFTDLTVWDGNVYWTVRDPFSHSAEGEWGAIRRLPIGNPPGIHDRRRLEVALTGSSELGLAGCLPCRMPWRLC